MLYRILLSIFIIALITSDATAQKNKKEEAPKLKSIPADFTDTGYVLLVQMYLPEKKAGKQSYMEERAFAWYEKKNNEKKEYLQKKYSKPYEIVSSDDIFGTDSKYDVNKYRYALVDSVRVISINMASHGAMPNYSNNDFHQYYIWDRLTKTLHPGVGVGRGTEIKAFKSAIDRLSDAKKP